jgi:hypothetical protein
MSEVKFNYNGQEISLKDVMLLVTVTWLLIVSFCFGMSKIIR